MQHNILEFWIDLNLPPVMAHWLRDDFNVQARSFKDLGFEKTPDIDVYKLAATQANTIIITTKDIDFIDHSGTMGHPPKILYLNVGNISNKELKEIIYRSFAQVRKMFLEPDKSFIELTK
jgi:predicted nuclease of predicted toxin-antitoxin system